MIHANLALLLVWAAGCAARGPGAASQPVRAAPTQGDQRPVASDSPQPTQTDGERALQPYTIACEPTDPEPDPNACVMLGFAFHNGVGVEQDMDQARTFYRRACDGGSTAGCAALSAASAPESEDPAACRTQRDDGPLEHSFTFYMLPSAPGLPVELRSAHVGVSADASDRLTASFTQAHGTLLACIGAVDLHGSMELRLRSDGMHDVTRTEELSEDQSRCLQAGVSSALTGLDRGETEVIRLRIGQAAADQPLRGSLSKEHIRTVIRAHIDEVRACYEAGMAASPELQGHVSVKFIIAPDGHVHVASIAKTTLGGPEVECCIVRAVKSWAFDAPEGGGIVVVTYPFLLQHASE